jgi:membrane-associated protease RseP (regulator of RpoE activity)
MMRDARSTAFVRGHAWAGCFALVAALVAGRPPHAADEAAPAAFVPGDISIGEPIVLPPSQAPAAAPATGAAANVPAGAVPGNGWLGIVVDESRTPGRWVVAEVTPGSPAAEAGIRAGDDVRAINGTLLRNADDVAQSLTAIAPGQPCSVAIARDEVVTDVRMTAATRPAPAVARAWQAAPMEPPIATPDRSRFAMPVSPPAATVTPPAVAVPAPASAVALPAQPAQPAASVLVPQSFPAPTATAVPERPTAPSAFAAAPASGFGPSPAVGSPARTAPPPAAPREFPPAVQGELPPATRAPVGRGRTALGVRTVPIDADTQSRFRLPALRGAYVIGVVQDLPAARAGVPPGSVIVALDARPVGSPDDLTRMVTSGPVGRPVSLEYVLPGGEAKRAEVVLQPLELPLEQALVGPAPTAAAGMPTLLPSPATGSVPPASEALPYRANRPADAATLDAAREELRRLRARLDALERELGQSPTRRL